MVKEIIGVTLGCALAGSAFAGGMVLSNNLKDDNYAIVLAEKEDDMNSLASSLSSLNEEISNRDSQIESLTASKDALQKQYDELLSSNSEDKQTIERLNGEISNLQEQIKNAGQDKEDLQNQLNSKLGELSTLQQQLQEKETKIGQLNQNISTLSEQVESYKSQVQNLQSQYDGVKSQYDSVNEQYQSLLQKSEVDKQQIQSLNENISSLNARISELEKEVSELQTSSSVDFFNLLSCDKLKISDERFLIYDKVHSKLYSLNKNNILKEVGSTVNCLLDFTKDYYRVLSNGDVLLGEFTTRGGVYRYKYEDDSFSSKDIAPGCGLRFVFEFSNDLVAVSSGSSYGSSGVVNLSSLTYKILNKVTLVDFLAFSHQNPIFDARSSAGSKCAYLFDIDEFDFKEVSSALGMLTTSKASYSLKNGDSIISNDALYYFDLNSLSIEKVVADCRYMKYFFEMSNGKVLMNSTQGKNYGFYILDPIEKSVIKISTCSSACDMDIFVEKEGKVQILSSMSDEYEYEYDINAETMTKIKGLM